MNYILEVYLDNNKENIAITKRFMVYQNNITIEAHVQPASIIEEMSYKQELNFTIKKGINIVEQNLTFTTFW